MKAMKLLSFFALFFAVFNLTSCATNDEPVDPIVLNGPNPASLKATFDGATFESNSVQAVLNDDYLSITGVNSTGAFFQITIPEARLGTYTWANFAPSDLGFALAYSAGTGNAPYIGARDDSGTYASFSNYTDTAEIKITSIDQVNRKISGTFHFTGVQFAAGSSTTVVTKEFTNGIFTNVTYADNTTPQGVNTFTAQLDAATFIPTTITGAKNAGKITVTAVRGSVENLTFSVPDTVIPGTYNLAQVGNYVFLYNESLTSVFSSSAGTITIISHNLSTKNIKGTFSFTATVSTGTGATHQITQGTFDVTYP